MTMTIFGYFQLSLSIMVIKQKIQIFCTNLCKNHYCKAEIGCETNWFLFKHNLLRMFAISPNKCGYIRKALFNNFDRLIRLIPLLSTNFTLFSYCFFQAKYWAFKKSWRRKNLVLIWRQNFENRLTFFPFLLPRPYSNLLKDTLARN